MMDWTRVYQAEFFMRRLNPDTWGDYGGRITLNRLTITTSCTEDVPLLQTASVETDERLEPGWYHIHMVARQLDEVSVPLGVYLYRGASLKHDYGLDNATSKLESVLKPVDMSVTLGEYSPQGSDGPQQAAKLISKCVKAPVSVEGSFTLSQHLVHAPGSTYLKAVWGILDSGGYCMQLDGDGVIHIMPKPDKPDLELGRIDRGIMLPGIDEDLDEELPNRYYAVQNGVTAVARNEDGDNPLSFKTRGYWEDVYDKSVVRIDGETLQAYADRKLHEASVRSRKVSYDREFEPGVLPFSIVRCGIPEEGLDGDARVVSQSYKCDGGITVSETICFTEDLWPRN